MKCKCGKEYPGVAHPGWKCPDCNYVDAALETLKEAVEAHPRRFPTPEPDGTIGERAATCLQECGESPTYGEIARIVDGIITDDTCRSVVRDWQKDKKDGVT